MHEASGPGFSRCGSRATPAIARATGRRPRNLLRSRSGHHGADVAGHMTPNTTENSCTRRFLLDTNVFLNAAFVANSKSQTFVDSFASDECTSIIVDEMIYRESADVLSRYALAQGLPDARILLDALERYTSRKGIIIVPPAPMPALRSMHNNENIITDVDKVHRHDKHVARAAKAYNATLITDDLRLVTDCHEEGIGAAGPDEYVCHEQATDGSPFQRDNGVIFARAYPGAWLKTRTDSRPTIMDVEGLGVIYYRNKDKRWRFDMDHGATVACHFDGPEDEQWIVCAQYKLDRRPGHIKLLAGVRGRTDSSRSSNARSMKMPGTWGPHKPTIGHDRQQQNHWNGVIGRLVFGAAWVGKEQWRALLRLSRMGPRVGEGDRLREALRQQFG